MTKPEVLADAVIRNLTIWQCCLPVPTRYSIKRKLLFIGDSVNCVS